MTNGSEASPPMPHEDREARAHALLVRGAEQLSGGEIPAAIETLTAAAELRPDHVSTLNNLGVALRAGGRAQEAIVAFGKAIAIDDAHAPSYANLAKTLYASGRFLDASAAAERAVELRPSDVGSLAILGTSLLALGRAGKSIPLLKRAVALSGGRADIRGALARAHDAVGDFEAALAELRAGLAADPKNDECLRLAARFEARERELKKMAEDVKAVAEVKPGDKSADFLHRAFTRAGGADRAPDDYVIQLFDRYAGLFDEHLLKALNYSAHKVVAEGVATALEGKVAPRVLDLGCGTGLCGELLRPHAGHLEGVDLSEEMLNRARARGHYDALHRAEIVKHLDGGGEPFDVVTAADVFVYFGDLGPAFRAVHRRLAPDGLFVLTVEWQDVPGYRLTESGRFKHGPDHIVESAKGLFEFDTVSNVVLRAEAGEPVLGLLCILKPTG